MMKGPDHKSLTIDERVQDRHRTVGDTGVWVDLLQHYEDASVIVEKRRVVQMNTPTKAS